MRNKNKTGMGDSTIYNFGKIFLLVTIYILLVTVGCVFVKKKKDGQSSD